MTTAANKAKPKVKPDPVETTRNEAHGSLVKVHNNTLERLESLSKAHESFLHIHGEGLKQTPAFALFVRAYNDLNEIRNTLGESAKLFEPVTGKEEDA